MASMFGAAANANANAAAENRRLEELAAARAVERQYAERMSQLSTDPLVRLQVNTLLYTLEYNEQLYWRLLSH